MSDATQYRSLESAASYLDVSEKTVRRYISQGKLPGYRLGDRKIRVLKSDLDKLLHRIPTTQQR